MRRKSGSHASSIAGALMERGRSGEGRHLDIAMPDGLVAPMRQSIAAWGMSGKPINTLPEVMGLEQLARRGMLPSVTYAGQPIVTAGMPWKPVAREGALRSPPALGEHTEEVLREWGVR